VITAKAYPYIVVHVEQLSVFCTASEHFRMSQRATTLLNSSQATDVKTRNGDRNFVWGTVGNMMVSVRPSKENLVAWHHVTTVDFTDLEMVTLKQDEE